MNKLFIRLLGVVLLVCTASVAFATQYPPGTPGGTLPAVYPDTLKIINMQDPAAIPTTVGTTDTTYGIAGIITGFDPKATGYGFYIQNSGGAPYTGIDVFTGTFNKKAAPWNFAVGDSVVCYGRAQDFGGGTELEGYDGVQGTDDCIVRKVSGGNTLPPFFVGTTTQLQRLASNAFAEQYEGMLVKIIGPLKVARTVGVGTNSFICISTAAPSDSVQINGNTLTTFPAPALNTIIDMVQGIYEQRTTYMIQLRDGNDITLSTPPNVTDAYPVADNIIRVTFDRNVTTATATDVNNYSLASFGSIDAAVMDGTAAAFVTVTNGLLHGDMESITANNIAGLANGLPMTSGQTRTFVNGVLSCAEVQAPQVDSLGLTPCLDKSRFAGSFGQTSMGNLGPRLTMTGTLAAKYTTLNYFADEAGGARSAVVAFGSPIPLTIGNRYLLVGQVQEYFGETEFSGIVDASDLGAGTIPAPVLPVLGDIDHDGCDATQSIVDAEDYEGMMVTIPLGRVILAEGILTPPTTGFHIRNVAGTDTIFVSNLNSVLSPFVHPAIGSNWDITGVLHYANNSFRICPRSWTDVVPVSTGVGENVLKVHFSVLQNPSARPRLVFGLPKSASVKLGVYDVTGRLITTLASGRLPAGEYSRAWDGRNSDGSKTNAGVYFYRLTVDGQTFSTRSIKLQ